MPVSVPPLADDCWTKSSLLKARCAAATPTQAAATDMAAKS
jgi:hypothetical protein